MLLECTWEVSIADEMGKTSLGVVSADPGKRLSAPESLSDRPLKLRLCILPVLLFIQFMTVSQSHSMSYTVLCTDESAADFVCPNGQKEVV